MVGCSAMVIIQAKEIRILTAATTTMAFSSALTLMPLKISPSHPVSG